MPLDEDETIIANAAYCIGALAAFFLVSGIAFYSDSKELAYFAISVSSLWGFISIGLYHHQKWGYYGLKTILYLMLPGYPLGTYIARRTLRHFEERDLKRFFH